MLCNFLKQCILFHIDPGEVTYVRDAITTAQLIKRNDVDAIEIHTSGR